MMCLINSEGSHFEGNISFLKNNFMSSYQLQLLMFPARFRRSSERCCCSKGLKVQSCALVRHVRGPTGREEMGVLHRVPVRGLVLRTKTLFMGRPTSRQGGAKQRGWQATRALCRTKYWHNRRAQSSPSTRTYHQSEHTFSTKVGIS